MKKIDRFNLDYHSLVVLMKVLECGSLTRAASELGQSQSAVSHCVDRLKVQLGDSLFYRSGRNIRPTQFLIDLDPRLRVIAAEIEGLPKKASFDPSQHQGRITIAANVTEFIPEFLELQSVLIEEAPFASFHFIELGSRDRLASLVENDEIKVAISVAIDGYPPTIAYKRLLSDHQLVFFDRNSRTAIANTEDYANAKHIVLNFGGTNLSTVDTVLKKAGLTRQVLLGVPNVACIKPFILGTDYICTMQSRLARHALSGLATCNVPFPMKPVSFDLVWHRRNENDPMTAWLRSRIHRVISPYSTVAL